MNYVCMVNVILDKSLIGRLVTHRTESVYLSACVYDHCYHATISQTIAIIVVIATLGCGHLNILKRLLAHALSNFTDREIRLVVCFSFGNPYYDDVAILAPLQDCCM